MFKTALNFIDNWLWIWLVISVVTFPIMAFFGIKWEKSGKTEADRKKYLFVICKIFSIILSISASAFVLSVIINFLRAVLS